MSVAGLQTTMNREGAYQGPKCPVVENDEGWLVCEMTGQVLDSQCKYLPNPMPQEYKCDEEEPMMILTDHEITELLQNKPNENSFLHCRQETVC